MSLTQLQTVMQCRRVKEDWDVRLEMVHGTGDRHLKRAGKVHKPEVEVRKP